MAVAEAVVVETAAVTVAAIAVETAAAIAISNIKIQHTNR